MDLALIITLLGTTAAIIGSVYGFLRNFKADINGHIDRLEKRMDQFELRSEKRMDQFEFRSEKRMDQFELKSEKRIDLFEKKMDLFKQELVSMEERMFFMATGKRLEDAILEEKMKQSKAMPSQ